MGRSKALENFPMLQKDSLKGAIVYYDGQHNDSRMNVALALTSIAQGSTTVNHIEVQDLIKEDTNELNKIKGAKVKDLITGEEFTIKAKVKFIYDY
jgi:glycerol-3-phosphate dehydrogenase